MNKIVINTCFGGFGLSQEQTKALAELKGLNKTFKDYYELFNELGWDYDAEGHRHDPDLVAVTEMGLPNAECSQLIVEEIAGNCISKNLKNI